MTVRKKPSEYYVLIERDEDGFYVGEVPQLRACYLESQLRCEFGMTLKPTFCCSCSEENPQWTLLKNREGWSSVMEKMGSPSAWSSSTPRSEI